MIQLQRILFATDFSDYAQRAKLIAQEFCARFKAEMHLLHVIHDLAVEVPEFAMGLSFPGFVENVGGQRRDLKAEALLSLEREVDASWRQLHPVVLNVRFGKPFIEIIKYSREHDIDMIVVGSHGRSGLTHMVLGSVAEKVVRKAPCPVLTMRQPMKVAEKEESQAFRPGIHPLPVV